MNGTLIMLALLVLVATPLVVFETYVMVVKQWTFSGFGSSA